MSKNWDIRWMNLAELVSSWSKDESTKVGAVAVDKDNRVLSLGWNGFPRGCCDDIPERHERPLKYKWFEHSERNLIFNSSANGHALKGSTIYVTMFPCVDCCRAIIQSGITKLVTVEPDWNHERWGDDFKIAKQMMDETGLDILFHQE